MAVTRHTARPDFKIVMMILAGLAFFVLVLPLASVIWVSFFENTIINFPPRGYTLDWYANAWSMPRFRDGFLMSVKVGAIATCVSILIGVPAAVYLARTNFWGREAIQTVLLGPLIVPGIVSGAALFMFLIELEVFSGLQLAQTFAGLCIAHSVIALPWTVRLVTASLVGMNRDVEQAALSMGARPLTVFMRITLPAIRPGIIAGGLFAFVISFIDLEKSLFLVGPGATTLPIEIINYLEWSIDPTIAAVATVQIAVIALVMIVTNRFFKLTRAF